MNELMPVVYIFGLFSIVLLITTMIIAIAYMVKRKKCSYPIVVEVVDVIRRRMGSGNRMGSYYYAPVIKYEYNGESYSYVPLSGTSNKKQYQIGDNLTVFISKEEPDNVLVSRLGYFVGVFVTLGLGVIMLAISGIIFYIIGM